MIACFVLSQCFVQIQNSKHIKQQKQHILFHYNLQILLVSLNKSIFVLVAINYQYRLFVSIIIMNFCNTDTLVNYIIRPSRDIYDTSKIDENTPQGSYRQDYRLTRGQDFILVSIIYSISKLDRCILYLHGNGGSRLEGLQHAQLINAEDWTLVVFDFLGCGLSSGEYITLGYKQAEQTQIVISFLRSLNPHIKICVWGRSMGAVTALRLPPCSEIVCMILDSPFCNLKEMSMNVRSGFSFLPRFCKQLIFRYINQKVQKQAGFSLNEVQITSKAIAPALFFGSKSDTTIPFQQITQAYKAYKGSKEFMEVKLRHNEMRTQSVIMKIFDFIRKAFIKDIHKKVSLSGSRRHTRTDTEMTSGNNNGHKPSTSDSFY